MHTLRVRPPRHELRPYIRTFVQRTIDSASPTIVEPTTAQLEQILAFDFGTPVEIWWLDGRVNVISATSAAGAQTRFACHMHLRVGVQSFGIFFKPTGLSRLLGLPICELTNRLDDASALIGPSIRMLWNPLGESTSFEDRTKTAEEFLLHKGCSRTGLRHGHGCRELHF